MRLLRHDRQGLLRRVKILVGKESIHLHRRGRERILYIAKARRLTS